MDKKATYNTIVQAANAARALGIKTSTQYRQQCIQDSRLPYSPEKVYVSNWEGWPAFLGTNRKRPNDIPSQFYATYSQAKRAVRLLGINTKEKYDKLYRKDPKLPADPQKVYWVHWRTWEGFLSKSKRVNRVNEIYKTLQQASKAAKALGPKTAREYINVYPLDNGLPSNPSEFYSNWKNWYHFLGTQKPYETLRKASRAAQSLKITSSRDYINRYKLDDRLPSNPSQFYESSWVSWSHFLGK